MAAGNRSGRKRKKKSPRRKWIRLNRRNHLKMMSVFFGIVLALAGLMARLVYIEHTSGQKYQKIVLAQANYDSQIIPFRRGDILDCNGIELATSLDVYNIILDSFVISSKQEYLEPTIQALMSSFPEELSETEIRTYIKENPQNRYKVLAKEIPFEEVQVFLAKQNDEEKDKPKKERTAKYIKGIWFEKEYKRNYPYKTLASSVIGSTTSGNLGMAGLENFYNSTLNGTNGRRYGYLNSDNAMERRIGKTAPCGGFWRYFW